MNKSNAVSPSIESPFKSDLEDSDRFKDMSYWIYEQNVGLYRQHFKHATMKLVDDASTKEGVEFLNGFNMSPSDSQQSKVCVIL